MKNLINFISTKSYLTDENISLLKKYFVSENVVAQTNLIKEGKVEDCIYFLSEGIVKGYQNIDGKIVIQHLIAEHDFFTSLNSFMHGTPSLDYFETVTDCKILKMTKSDFEILNKTSSFWNSFAKEIINEHLACKMERVKDFQILTAKERYLKFLNKNPKLALNVSIDNIASFLGMEPQSLSRIRKQIAF